MHKTLALIYWIILTACIALTTACGGSSGGSNAGSNAAPLPRQSQPVVPPAAEPTPPSDVAPTDGVYRPALADSPYANDLVACINIETLAQACRLSRLPFQIGRAHV